jgi:hypothetical protein
MSDDEWLRQKLAPLRDEHVPTRPRLARLNAARKAAARPRWRGLTGRRAWRSVYLVPIVLLITTAAGAAVISVVRSAIHEANVRGAAHEVDYQAVLPVGRSGQRDIALLDTRGGTLAPLLEEPGDQFDPAWSSDGRWVYYTSLSSGSAMPAIWRISPSAKNVPERVSSDGLPATAPHPAPDGSLLAFSSSRPAAVGEDVWLSDADGKDARLLLDSEQAGLTDGFAIRGWTPDSHRVIGVVGRPGDRRLLELASVDLEGRLEVYGSLPPVAPAGWVTVSPASGLLAYVGWAEEGPTPQRLVLYVVSMDDWRIVAEWRAPADTDIAWPAWSEDGTIIAFVSDFGHPIRRCRDEGYTYPCPDLGIDLWRIADREPVSLADGPHTYAPFWTSNDQVVFWLEDSDGRLGLWSVATGGAQIRPLVTDWQGDVPEDSVSVRQDRQATQ